MTLLSILGACAGVMLLSLSGKLLTWKGIGRFIEHNLHFFVSFAAGVLLVVAYNLSQEIVEHAGSLTAGVPWIALGAVGILIAFRYLPHFHHHHDKGSHAHSEIDANRVLASDAIHNVGDGAVVAMSFLASPALGIATTISIAVHEMLQEISEFFVLREAGLSVRKALVLNLLTSATIFVGAIGAYFLLAQFSAIQVPLMGLAIGSYLVVVFHDLLPHSLEGATDLPHTVLHALYFFAGLVLMVVIGALIPHI